MRATRFDVQVTQETDRRRMVVIEELDFQLQCIRCINYRMAELDNRERCLAMKKVLDEEGSRLNELEALELFQKEYDMYTELYDSRIKEVQTADETRINQLYRIVRVSTKEVDDAFKKQLAEIQYRERLLSQDSYLN